MLKPAGILTRACLIHLNKTSVFSSHSFRFFCCIFRVFSPDVSSVRYDDAAWTLPQLPACFLYLVNALEDYARRGSLPHFFVPDCNLFSPAVFPRKARDFLVNALEQQRREGMPLLKPPAPVSPLRSIRFPGETTAGKPAGESSLLTADHSMKLILGLIVALALCGCVLALNYRKK